MSHRIHQSLSRVLRFPLAVPVGRNVGPQFNDSVDPALPSDPYEIEALYSKAVVHLRQLVERDGTAPDAALKTVIAENLLGLAQINQLETQARARYAAQAIAAE